MAFIQKIVAEDVVTKSTSSSYAYLLLERFQLLIFRVHIHFPQNIYNFIMILMCQFVFKSKLYIVTS